MYRTRYASPRSLGLITLANQPPYAEYIQIKAEPPLGMVRITFPPYSTGRAPLAYNRDEPTNVSRRILPCRPLTFHIGGHLLH